MRPWVEASLPYWKEYRRQFELFEAALKAVPESERGENSYFRTPEDMARFVGERFAEWPIPATVVMLRFCRRDQEHDPLSEKWIVELPTESGATDDKA